MIHAEKSHQRIIVHCDPDGNYAKFMEGIKTIEGKRFRKVSRDWSVPCNMDTARVLKRTFGKDLSVGPKLREWARLEQAEERNLGGLTLKTSGKLTRLPEVLPKLYEAIHLGPKGRWMTKKQRKKALKKKASYQAADVLFLAQSPAPINTNQPGLGKTLEHIAAVFEADLDDGPQLVVAPVSAIETVWVDELTRWQPHPVLACIGTRAQRQKVLDEAMRMAKRKMPFWLIVNDGMVQFRKDPSNTATDYLHLAKPKDRTKACRCDMKRSPHWHYEARYPELFRIPWSTFMLDECHMSAVANEKSITHQALKRIQCAKRCQQSGTPMGGQYLKLFGLLRFGRPERHTSKWTWAKRWLVVDDSGMHPRIINELKPGVKKDFDKSLAPYILRRTKEEVLPWLPPKQIIPVWCRMTPTQEAVYEEFAAEAEITIDKHRLVGKGILDEYTRLRQFANCRYEANKRGLLVPTTDSGKLLAMRQDMTELGICGDARGDAQLVMFSQFSRVCEMLHTWLIEELNVHAELITGKVKTKERTRIQRQFQDGKASVLVMNVKAGGVAINLDRADNVFMVDETWNPDDSEQAEDRCHRASRIHQVTVRYYRSIATIEEVVYDDVTGKQKANLEALDVRRLASGK